MEGTPAEPAATLPAAPAPPIPATPNATGQAIPGEPPQAPPPSAPAIPQHPIGAAISQLQGLKGDPALLLQAGVTLMTDDLVRLRTKESEDRLEISALRERAHKAEINSSILKERAETASARTLTRDATVALGGLLGGVGFAGWQSNGLFGPAVFVIGVALIVGTVFIGRRGGETPK